MAPRYLRSITARPRDGAMDDLVVYARALTDLEVFALSRVVR